MRVKLYLKIEKGSEIHLQYAYALQGVIYKVIQQADPEFSEWLHMKGYNSTDRPFKLFTYSALSGFPYVINQQKQT
ncbi:MAG: hypothetical protein KBA06_04415, partial [Saprospiraceae bacterium]|nr:hypothetical protein [Saprospiraceae bacterium]